MDELTNSAPAADAAQASTEPMNEAPADEHDEAAELDASLDEIFSRHESGGGESGDKDADQPAADAKTGAGADAKANPAQDTDKAPDATGAPSAAASAIPAPNTWNAEEKAAWDAAPDKVKSALLRRAAEVDQFAQQSIGARNFARAMQPFGKLFATDLRPYFESAKAANGAPLWGNPQAMAQEIKEVLEAKQLLQHNPAEGMRVLSEWAKSVGVDLNAAAQQAANGQQWRDPDVSMLKQKLAQMEAQGREREARQMALAQEARQQQTVQQVASSIDAMAVAKNDTGSPEYPHLSGEHGEAVGAMMGRFIRANITPAGLTPALFRQAYEAAVFSTPATREAEMKAREDARVAQYKQRAQRAREAAGLVPGQGAPGRMAETMSAEDAMESVWKRYNA